MEKLTISEKRTIYQILIVIMNADLLIHPAETAFLDKVFLDFGLDIGEFDHADDLDLDYLIHEFAQFSTEAREQAAEIFWDMAKCDGVIDPREAQLIERLLNN